MKKVRNELKTRFYQEEWYSPYSICVFALIKLHLLCGLQEWLNLDFQIELKKKYRWKSGYKKKRKMSWSGIRSMIHFTCPFVFLIYLLRSIFNQASSDAKSYDLNWSSFDICRMEKLKIFQRIVWEKAAESTFKWMLRDIHCGHQKAKE